MRLAFSRAVAFAFLISAFASKIVSAQQLSAFLPNPDPPEFIPFVQPDLRITLARDEVLEILSSTNSCSAWFQRLAPSPAATFASLKFKIDFDGPQYVTGDRSSSGTLLFTQPYAASAVENSGPGSVIMLNANGPFFVRHTAVLQRDIPGSSLHHVGWRTLSVGSYPGNSPAAQITVLLHEFAHVVGRIPEDTDALSGRSGRNTAEVLRFCHAQINAADRLLRHHQP